MAKYQITLQDNSVFEIDTEETSPEPIETNIREKMTLGGFGKNIVQDLSNVAGGISKLATGAITAIPKAGYDIGYDIAKTLKENRSVVDPTLGVRELAKKALYPVKHPLQYAGQVLTPVNELSKGIISQVSETARHPIKTAYKEPISTALLVSPVAGKIAGRFTPAAKLAKSQKLVKEATNTYRSMLRPTQGEVKTLEIKLEKNIDDYYKLAAEEKLPIKRTPDKKLDTKDAIKILDQKAIDLHTKLDDLLSKSKETININDIYKRVDRNLSKSFNNASELEKARLQALEYLQDEIKLRGDVVSLQEANTIKQGMWSVGYDALKPTSKKVARAIGYEIKNSIQNKVPEGAIKELNAMTGKYLTLKELLKNANGRVIKGGRLGEYFARSIGAGVGGVAGMSVPIPGSAAAGAVIGQQAGKEILSMLNDPARVSSSAARKMMRAQRLAEDARSGTNWFSRAKGTLK